MYELEREACTEQSARELVFLKPPRTPHAGDGVLGERSQAEQGRSVTLGHLLSSCSPVVKQRHRGQSCRAPAAQEVMK